MKTVELILDKEQNYFVHEAFNTLRTNILFSGKNVRTILITSCIAHEGKTTVSFELSRSLAEIGKKVLLVDADLRKSMMVSRYTKNRGITGLSQLLSGQVELDQAIHQTQIEGMDIIFAGPYPPNPTVLVGSDSFKELMVKAREIYDYVIVDAPPLGLVIDAAVMASTCDGVCLVVNAGATKYRMAQKVIEQLNKTDCEVLGVVLNQANRKSSSTGYYGTKYGEYQSYHSDAAKEFQRNATTEAQPTKRPVRPTDKKPEQK